MKNNFQHERRVGIGQLIRPVFNLTAEFFFVQHRTNGTPSNCTICRQKLHSSRALEVHLDSSHSRCPDCTKSLPTHAGMLAHRQAKHSPLAPDAAVVFFCHLACGRTFLSKALRDEHVPIDHFVCEHCHRPFLSDVALQTHITSAHSHCDYNICLRKFIPELYCDVCAHQFASLGQLQDHYLESSNHTQCTICTTGFPDVAKLQDVGDFIYPLPIKYECFIEFSTYLAFIPIPSIPQSSHRKP